MAIARQQILIGAAQGTYEQPILDWAAIDEEKLMVGYAAIIGRDAGKTAKPQIACRLADRAVEIDRHGIVGKVGSKQRRKSRYLRRWPGLATAGNGKHPPPVMAHFKADIGTRHRQPADDIETGGEFGALGFEELASRRHGGE
jgi:hypothetical protein